MTLEREKDNHKGCPNYSFCEKDEEKCCYLVQNRCIIGDCK